MQCALRTILVPALNVRPLEMDSTPTAMPLHAAARHQPGYGCLLQSSAVAFRASVLDSDLLPLFTSYSCNRTDADNRNAASVYE